MPPELYEIKKLDPEKTLEPLLEALGQMRVDLLRSMLEMRIRTEYVNKRLMIFR